ncbi:hypothetical protein BDV10DRAFT_31732 [Aspergillus recurvatus]
MILIASSGRYPGFKPCRVRGISVGRLPRVECAISIIGQLWIAVGTGFGTPYSREHPRFPALNQGSRLRIIEHWRFNKMQSLDPRGTTCPVLDFPSLPSGPGPVSPSSFVSHS